MSLRKPGRINFHSLVKTRSGKTIDGNEVFVALKNRTIASIRKLTPLKIAEHHMTFAKKMKSISMIWKSVSERFKEDLKKYTQLYNTQINPTTKVGLNPYALFVKVLGKNSEPISDPTEIVILFGNNINAWIQNGHLPNVTTKDLFNADVVS